MSSIAGVAKADAVARGRKRLPGVVLLAIALGAAAVRVLALVPETEPMSTGRREFFVRAV